MTGWNSTGACSKTCGGGTRARTRTVKTAPLWGGMACGPTNATLGCNNVPCPTYKYAYSRWGGCSAACGGGTRRRLASCRRSDGKAVAKSHCAASGSGTTLGAVAQACNPAACATFRWQPGAWGPCSKACTGSDGVVGKATRVAPCTTGAPTTVADAQCTAAKPATERACNSRACVTYGWSIGAWSTCTKTCGGGTLTRTVACAASDSSSATAETCRIFGATGKPATTTACNMALCDPCAGQTCSGHGSCAAGACTCSGGFGGFVCDSPPSCAGVLDKTNACCLGALLPDGSCCASAAGKSASIAADGSCCAAGATDVCGVCGGTATAVDAVGVCCSGTIGEDSLCCASGAFDTCGVCDGDDSSCNVAADLAVAPPAGDTAATIMADVAKLQSFKDSFKAAMVTALAVPANSVSVTGVVKQDRRRLHAAAAPHRRLAATLKASFELNQAQVKAAGGGSAAPVSALNVLDSLATATASGAGVLAGATVGSVAAKAVCGNGACEEGERCTDSTCAAPGCKADCPYVVQACPSPSWAGGGQCSRRGRCISASGACACFNTYVGAACDECAVGYKQDPSTHACVRQLSAAERATPAPTPALSTIAKKAAASASGAIAGGVAGALIVGGGVWWSRRGKGTKSAAVAPSS